MTVGSTGTDTQSSGLTSLWKHVVLGEFHALGSRVTGDRAHDKVSVERIKLLSAVAVDGSTQTPDHREEKQSLKPQRHLLTGHWFGSVLSGLNNLICTHKCTSYHKPFEMSSIFTQIAFFESPVLQMEQSQPCDFYT